MSDFGVYSPNPQQNQKQLNNMVKPKTQQISRRNQKGQVGSADVGNAAMITQDIQ